MRQGLLAACDFDLARLSARTWSTPPAPGTRIDRPILLDLQRRTPRGPATGCISARPSGLIRVRCRLPHECPRRHLNRVSNPGGKTCGRPVRGRSFRPSRPSSRAACATAIPPASGRRAGRRSRCSPTRPRPSARSSPGPPRDARRYKRDRCSSTTRSDADNSITNGARRVTPASDEHDSKRRLGASPRRDRDPAYTTVLVDALDDADTEAALGPCGRRQAATPVAVGVAQPQRRRVTAVGGYGAGLQPRRAPPRT